ncbi:MAG TPA: cytochrome c oxidase assembly factor Coa1 family protein [Pyrinomonadaceae bacterium]|nr:cytochrome c oxidase assembly factor Coa1 family protein [Pyrinomonadaceae bacterium]
MTTKKIVILVISIVLGLGLIVAVVAGAIVGIALYAIGNSEAAESAKTFLRNNEQLKQDIGEITSFGNFPTGNVSVESNSGNATINLKVYGERKTVNASVDLIYRNGQPWRVVAASYENDAGETVQLLDPYQTLIPPLKLAA